MSRTGKETMKLVGSAKAALCIIFAAAFAAYGQSSCPLAGSYRIDIEASDKLYSIVRGARSSVPFADQQRFFMDLSTRLTPPDMLAFECRGKRVSIASSRSSRVTFTADGARRRESRPGGGFVNSRVELGPDTLTFTSDGAAEDNVNVSFQALDGGQRLKVVRSITTEQLDEPLVIQTFYDRVSEGVNWDNFANPRLARNTAEPAAPLAGGTRRNGDTDAEALRSALEAWIRATNRRDIPGQMAYYVPQLTAYYLTRNPPRQAVRDEKQRVFAVARSVDIRAEEPEIIFQDGGTTAVMRFRKKYRVAERSRTKSGEVVQELRWRRTDDGWRIFSERDIRVIR